MLMVESANSTGLGKTLTVCRPALKSPVCETLTCLLSYDVDEKTVTEKLKENAYEGSNYKEHCSLITHGEINTD